MPVPDRWLNYTNSAKIKGTRFIACKVPLKMEICRNLPPHQRFTGQNLLDDYPNLKMVIDLTFTTKYYQPHKEFIQNGVQYLKVKSPGRKLPREKDFEMFVNAVNSFMKDYPEDTLVAVHCTHGVNRTGYVICRYMIEVLGYDPDVAMKEFAMSRGHQLEREIYINDLHKRNPGSNSQGTLLTGRIPSSTQPHPQFRPKPQPSLRTQQRSKNRRRQEFSGSVQQEHFRRQPQSSSRGRDFASSRSADHPRSSFRDRGYHSSSSGNQRSFRPEFSYRTEQNVSWQTQGRFLSNNNERPLQRPFFGSSFRTEQEIPFRNESSVRTELESLVRPLFSNSTLFSNNTSRPSSSSKSRIFRSRRRYDQ